MVGGLQEPFVDWQRGLVVQLKWAQIPMPRTSGYFFIDTCEQSHFLIVENCVLLDKNYNFWIIELFSLKNIELCFPSETKNIIMGVIDKSGICSSLVWNFWKKLLILNHLDLWNYNSQYTTGLISSSKLSIEILRNVGKQSTEETFSNSVSSFQFSNLSKIAINTDLSRWGIHNSQWLHAWIFLSRSQLNAFDFWETIRFKTCRLFPRFGAWFVRNLQK